MSKGSKQRPIANKQQFDYNWDIIFNKPKQKEICDNFGRYNCTETADCDYKNNKENSQYGDH